MNMFRNIQSSNVKRNKFDLSHERKLSGRMGFLLPSMVQEVVPGDKFKVSSEIFMRMAPMLAPVMHRVNVYTHFFFVPNRLIWDEWEKFITGGVDGTEEPVWPYIRISSGNQSTFTKGQLSDYLGIPVTDDAVTVTENLSVSALPFRAYQKIYNEYYRDQTLHTEIAITSNSGQITDSGEIAATTGMRSRCWEKDYFTSCLPWTQRGTEAQSPLSHAYAGPDEIVDSNDNLIPNADLTTDPTGKLQATTTGSVSASVDNTDSLGMSINQLRLAVRVQEWLERNARGGSRYIEQILSHFGIMSKDARLQRPEYLGGGRAPVVMSEVLQTTGEQTPSTFNPLGTMGGHGVAVGKANTFKGTFTEHGIIMGIMSVIPKSAYQQGLNKMWRRTDRTDYYWPSFAHLGEQEVQNLELYVDYVTATAGDTFGYAPRYSDYKFQADTVHGDFKDNLSFWHQGRIFDSQPSLNGTFVNCKPSDRIFAVQTSELHHLYAQIYNKVSALRKMPYYGTPYL